MISRFSQLRDEHLEDITSLMQQVVRDASEPTLQHMYAYHMDTGGKRLRALLPLLVADALDHDPAPLVPFGAACEMVHNATLVHDDLQDKDTMRRGHPTVWSHFGERHAINLGDAMFYYALLLAQQLPSSLESRESIVTQMLEGTLCVIGGQEKEFALQLEERPTLDAYFTMVEGKTSGLFMLPMSGAAMLCGASDVTIRGLSEAARHMGVLFQVQDDVLDVYGDKGRDRLGSDIGEGKRSLLAVHALNHASSVDAKRLHHILAKTRLDTTHDDVREAIEIFGQTGALAFSLETIQTRKQQAIDAISSAELPTLTEMITSMCTLFAKPIQQVRPPSHTVQNTGAVLNSPPDR
jgi:geranylgeranyl pyrophosphate synthase